VEHDVRVRRSRGSRIDDEHATAHAQMDHDRLARVQVARQILAVASRGDDARAGRSVDQRLAARATHGALAADLDAGDQPTDDE
jgi:hypothetical protein